MPEYPTGTVTFLFTDIEGSTKLWERAPEVMAVALARHDALLRQAIETHGGIVFKTVGDAFCAAFPTAPAALAAASDAQRGLDDLRLKIDDSPSNHQSSVFSLRVRMALHTGSAEYRDGDYFGPTLNRVARLLATGHGGQVLLSQTAYDLARDHLPGGVGLRDLGEHRLRDLTRPEHIFQLVLPDLPADFPPLKTLDSHPHNLPVQLTPLIGRERELGEVHALVVREDVRLVTLTGVGGVGKTRLALQAAAELLDHFQDGCYFVPLTTEDPALVPAAVAQAVGVREQARRPLLMTLKDWLQGKHVLLALDNFEQVVDAASLVWELLAAAPGLKALVTSRSPLRLRGEHEYPVPPLALPPRTEDGGRRTEDGVGNREYEIRITQYGAVRLFIDRARAVKPDFEVTNDNAPAVAEICLRLDGLPLAIELAAARSRLFTPSAMLARLSQPLKFLTGGARDLPPRQQTLRNAIAWSYRLLSSAEQRLFARLAVFVGGCTLDAVEAVCNADGDLELDVLDGVESLVVKSLLQAREGVEGEPRFAMLPIIAEYGREVLAESGEMEALRARHAAYYLALAEAIEPRLQGPRPAAWLDRLDGEYDNLRAALRWGLETGQIEWGLRLTGALRWYWPYRNRLTEGRAWLDQVLRQPGADASPALGKALAAAGTVAFVQGDYASATALYEQALAHYRESGDKRGMARALHSLGAQLLGRGEYPQAQALVQESASLCRELGDTVELANALNTLGEVARSLGDDHAAEAYYQEGLTLSRQSNNTGSLPWLFHNLGHLALHQGDDRTAEARFRQSLALAEELGFHLESIACVAGLGAVCGVRGDAARAVCLLGATDALMAAEHSRFDPPDQAEYDHNLALARAHLSPAAFDAAWAEGRTMTLEQAVAAAKSIISP